jgi:hypothetical protein
MALRFKTKPEAAEIPLTDGAIVTVKRPTGDTRRNLRQAAKEIGLTDSSEIVDYILERHVTGWTGIEDGDTGKPLPFNPENRNAIYSEILQSEESAKAFFVFVEGNLGN